jgi:hypothetical protein
MKPTITPISIPTIAATTKAPTRTIRLYFFLDLLLVIAVDRAHSFGSYERTLVSGFPGKPRHTCCPFGNLTLVGHGL